MTTYKAKDLDLQKLGLNDDLVISRNLSYQDLVLDIVNNGEGYIASSGAVMIDSGKYTGRSPKDKYIVDEISSNDKIWWGEVNQKISEKIFDHLYSQVIKYYNNSKTKTYMFDGFAGAEEAYNLSVRFLVKKAWQAHFVNNMFIRPKNGELDSFEPGSLLKPIALAIGLDKDFIDKNIKIQTSPGTLTLNGNVVHDSNNNCLLYTSPSPRDLSTSRMPSSA